MTVNSWRDADRPAGVGRRPPSVSWVVRRAHLGLSAARWGESVLIGTGAVATTLAAAAVGGAELAWIDAWIVSLLAGGCAAAAWRLEHRRDERTVARRLDRRLRHRGALVTAFEVEARGIASPVADLLRARVLARLRTREALHAIAPPLAFPLAAFLLGVALLVLALEGEAPEEEGVWLDPSAMAAELDGMQRQTLAAMDEGTVDETTARELNGVEHRVDRLSAALARPEEDAAALLEEVEALDRQLVDLSSRLARDPGLSARLEAVRPYLDAVRMGLADAEPPAGEGESADTAQTGEGGHGTIPGSSGAGGGDAIAPPTALAAPVLGPGVEAGSLAGRWWGKEYDGIVARWVEHLRRDEPRD